ncbi:putative IDLSRF-like peptide [Hypsibius exemplaris]|uniref:IDLSRF-like peptide n=1 Tax=Hypsibius exemplaris TaxID=2072580 RepID=A0A1W0WCT6_HYPEX|nr:putative IDLSRF-like peptide [Hypsibius exemplaris]
MPRVITAVALLGAWTLVSVTLVSASALRKPRFDRLLQWNPADRNGFDYDESVRDLFNQELRFVKKAEQESQHLRQNPSCPPTEPFLCPGSGKKCISLGFVCDGSSDCPDGYDENKAVCAAAKRPPVRETATFLNNLLKSHGANFLVKIFGDTAHDKLAGMGGVASVAVLLSESPTIDDFAAATKLSPKNTERFRAVLTAMEKGDLDELRTLGITDSELADTKFFLDKIIATGFVSK